MSSRAHQKAAARQHRLTLEADRERAARRRRRVTLLALAAGAALAVVAVSVALSRGGAEPPVETAAASTTMAGIPQDGISLGNADAPYTLVEFADLQCPFCGVYGRDVLPTVIDRYVRTGQVRLELHVLTFLGEDSVRAGRVAAGAAAQGRLWSFTDSFYANQGAENTGYVTDAFLRATAGSAGVDLAAAQADPGADAVLQRAQAEAERLQVAGTPSFFLRRGDGDLEPVTVDDMTPAAFTTALDDALAR
jgi:protein-disulfide isomerase